MQSTFLGSPLNLDVGFIPSQLHYIVLYEGDQDKIPKIVPYISEDITFEQLISNSVNHCSNINAFKLQAPSRSNPSKILNKHAMILKQRGGKDIDMKSTIQEYRMKTRKKCLDGCQFILSYSNQFSNQSVQTILVKKSSPEKHDICLVLPDMEKQVYLTIEINDKDNILNQIVKTINSRIKNTITIKDFMLMDLEMELDQLPSFVSFRFRPKNRIYNIEEHLLMNDGLHIFYVVIVNNRINQCLAVQDETKRGQLCENKKMHEVSNPRSKTNIFPQEIIQAEKRIIKIIFEDKSSVLLDFDKIRNIQVRFLLSILKVKNSHCKGLNIFNSIYPPCTTLDKLSNILKGCLTADINAYVIDESLIFLKYIQNEGKVSIKDMQIFLYDNLKNNIIQNSSLLKENKQMPNLGHLKRFMSEQNIQQEQNNNFQNIHYQINKYISRFGRESNTQQQQKCQKGRFVKSLCSQIQGKPVYEGKAYRRVYYKLDKKEGDILEFKGFVVASIDPHYVKDYTKGSTFFIIHSKKGRQVESQTNFTANKKIIFLPHSRFKITKIQQSNAKETEIEMEELIIEQPSTKSSFLLWVDDKLNEGKNKFPELAKVNNSIFTYQFVSTDCMNIWIKLNQQFINTDKSIHFIVISNMKRTENEKVVNDAGVKTLEDARIKIPNLEFIFYIQNVEGTKKALQNRDIKMNGLIIINTGDRFMETLNKSIKSWKEQKYEENKVSLIYAMPEKENWNGMLSQSK